LLRKNRYLIAAIGIGAALWIIDAFLDVMFFGSASIIKQIFYPPIGELSARILLVLLIVASSFYINRIISRQKRVKRRLRLLNTLLKTIRTFHSLNSKDRRLTGLIRNVCDQFVLSESYKNMWIAILDDNDGIRAAAEAGLGERFLNLLNEDKTRIQLLCWKVGVKGSKVSTIDRSATECAPCSCFNVCAGSMTYAVRLEHMGKVDGIMVANLPLAIEDSEEERKLYEEIAREVINVIHNIDLANDHKVVGEELKDSKEKYKRLIESMTEGVCVIDKDGKAVYANDRLCSMIGFELSELIDTKIEDYVEEQNKVKFRQMISSIDSVKIDQDKELAFIKKNK